MRVRRIMKFVKPRTGELVTFESKQYYVTDTGDVYDGTRKRYIAQGGKNGYQVVNLFDDNRKHHNSVGVHVLLASVFQRLLKQGEVVHHINHDRKDNRLENLEIITASEHQRQHILENRAKGTYDNQKKQVAQLDMDGHLVRVWHSTMECHRNGYDHGAVAACCIGKRKSHKGFRWQWYV